jgi:hypothetical protein
MRGVRWVLAATLAVTGCGARTLPAEGGPTPRRDAAEATEDAGTAGPGVPFYVCPFSPPPADSACDNPGQICVYEDLPSCPTIVCLSGHWQMAPEGC